MMLICIRFLSILRLRLVIWQNVSSECIYCVRQWEEAFLDISSNSFRMQLSQIPFIQLILVTNLNDNSIISRKSAKTSLSLSILAGMATGDVTVTLLVFLLVAYLCYRYRQRQGVNTETSKPEELTGELVIFWSNRQPLQYTLYRESQTFRGHRLRSLHIMSVINFCDMVCDTWSN